MSERDLADLIKENPNIAEEIAIISQVQHNIRVGDPRDLQSRQMTAEIAQELVQEKVSKLRSRGGNK